MRRYQITVEIRAESVGEVLAWLGEHGIKHGAAFVQIRGLGDISPPLDNYGKTADDSAVAPPNLTY